MNARIGTDTSDPRVFAYWAELAAKDPERFELERKAMIDQMIAQAPEEKRAKLQKLQTRVEVERALATSPLDSCARIAKLTAERLSALSDSLIDLQAELLVVTRSSERMDEAGVLSLFK